METFAATTTDDWRAWLAEHGRSAAEIWLVIQHRDSGTPSPRYPVIRPAAAGSTVP